MTIEEVETRLARKKFDSSDESESESEPELDEEMIEEDLPENDYNNEEIQKGMYEEDEKKND